MTGGVVTLGDEKVFLLPVVNGFVDFTNIDEDFPDCTQETNRCLDFLLGFVCLNGGRNDCNIEVFGTYSVSEGDHSDVYICSK